MDIPLLGKIVKKKKKKKKSGVVKVCFGAGSVCSQKLTKANLLCTTHTGCEDMTQGHGSWCKEKGLRRAMQAPIKLLDSVIFLFLFLLFKRTGFMQQSVRLFCSHIALQWVAPLSIKFMLKMPASFHSCPQSVQKKKEGCGNILLTWLTVRASQKKTTKKTSKLNWVCKATLITGGESTA